MRLMKKIRFAKKWKTLSIAGYVLTLSGLIVGTVLISQFASVIIKGQLPQISSLVLSLELTTAILFVATGFALMVAGADPFDDASEEFSFLQQEQEWEVPAQTNEFSDQELTHV